MRKPKKAKKVKGPAITLERAKKVLAVVDKGLIAGIGEPIPGEMCVEAAVAYAFGEKHTDQPKCVAPFIRSIKIDMNDEGDWSSPQNRASGLRRVAIAQLGTAGKITETQFWTEVTRLLHPKLMKEVESILNSWPKGDDLRSIENYSNDLSLAVETAKDRQVTGLSDLLDAVGLHYADAAEVITLALKNLKSPGSKFLYLTKPPAGFKMPKPD